MSNPDHSDPTRSRRLLAGLVTVVGVGAGIAVPVIAAGASRGADDRPAVDGTVERRGRGLDDAATSTVPTVPTSVVLTVPTVPTTEATVPTVPTTVATTTPSGPSTTVDDHGRRRGGHGADDVGSTTVPTVPRAGGSSPSTTWDDHGGDRDRDDRIEPGDDRDLRRSSDDDSDDDRGRGRGRGRGGDDRDDDSSGRG